MRLTSKLALLLSNRGVIQGQHGANSEDQKAARAQKTYVGGPLVGSAVPDMVAMQLSFETRAGLSGMLFERLLQKVCPGCLVRLFH